MRSVRLVSLRDDALETLGLHRRQLVATSAAHYRCTRHWAATLGGQAVDGMLADGLVWNSRVAELARADSPLLDDLLIDDASLSAVLWRRPGAATAVTLQGEVVDDLTAGPGRALVDAVAEQLDAEIH